MAAKRGRGRKPKTTAVAVVEAAPVAVPCDLPDGAHELYRVAVAELLPRGLRPVDLEAIRQMSLSAHYARQAERHIEAHGLLIATEFGERINPMLKLHRDESDKYMKIANEYGLTIASRLRLGLLHLAGESLLAGIDKEIGITVKA
ncbi:MAG: P27 family phage terminase small subunit [Actinomycetes bacterium]